MASVCHHRSPHTVVLQMHKKQVEEQQAKQAALEARLKKQMEDNARMASQQEVIEPHRDVCVCR